ncbi:hypothetical protein Tco_1571320 [Tanacetum coccineum]
MDDPNMTMEEYIKLEEQKAHRRDRVFNWRTTTYGKIRIDDDLHDLRSVEAEFLAIVINDAFAPQDALLCKSQVSTPVNDEIDFIISFDESDDEDYTIIYFFKDFENEFSAIVYNDARTSKYDYLTEQTLSPRHNNESDLNDETSLSEYDVVGQNVLYFNDLFHFNVIHPIDLKSYEDNDNKEIDIIQSSEGNEIIHGSSVLSETSRDKVTKTFRMGSFVINLKVKIVIWRYYINGMLFFLIMNLYVSFGIPFNPKRYYKDGNYAIMLRRPRYKGLEYTDANIVDFVERMVMEHRDDAGRARRRLSWRQFILALGLHIGEEMDSPGFARYWSKSERMILEKGDLHDYWRSISTDGDFLGPLPSYTLIRDSVLRLYHRMMAHSIAGRSQAPEKVTVADLFYLRGLDVGSFVARLAEHFGLLTAKILGGLTVDDTWAWVAMGPERQPDAVAGAPGVAQDVPIVDESGQADPTPVQAPPPPAASRTMLQRMARLEEDVHEIHGALTKQRKVIDAMARDFSRFSTWTVIGLARMIDKERVTYMPYSETHVPYQRRLFRQRIGEASTSAAQQDLQQRDP